MWNSRWGALLTSVGRIHYTQLLFYSILFYSILFSWPYVTGPVVGMCGDGGGRSLSRGERPHWGAVKLSTSRTTGLWSKAAWFMAYGLPHWGETVQFPYEDTADVVASGHASSCSVKVLHQKYPGYFLWMETFSSRHTSLYVSEVKYKLYCGKWYWKVRLMG